MTSTSLPAEPFPSLVVQDGLVTPRSLRGAASVGLTMWALATPGCTFGPSDENPLLGATKPESSAPADSPRVPETEPVDGEPDTAAPHTTAAPVPAQAPVSPPDASITLSGSDAGDLSWLLPPAASCLPAKDPAVCDPVRNTGCPPIPLMQCDVDPAAELTGRCAIFTPTPIVSCAATTTEQSVACLARTACVDDRCVPLCHCDDDCPTGTTCSHDTVSGFRLCR